MAETRRKRGAFLDSSRSRGDLSVLDKSEDSSTVESRREEEVKQAELEVKLREMVLEVTAPTIERGVMLQNHCEHLSNRLELQHQILTSMCRDVQESKETLDLVHQFKIQLDNFWESQNALETKLLKHTKEVMEQVERSAQACATLTSTTERLSSQLSRAQEDTDFLRMDIMKMQSNLEMGLKKNKDYVDSELKRMDLSMKETKDLMLNMCEEIWGPEDPTEVSPPSLRRFDMQIRNLQKTQQETLKELQALRLLDAQMQKVTAIQEGHTEQLANLEEKHANLHDRVEKLNKDTKEELKKTANQMAAYTANLLREVRGSFSKEVSELSSLHEDVQKFLKETDNAIQQLTEGLHAMGRHLEAALREVRIDMEGLDGKRKRDKMCLEDDITNITKQVEHHTQAADNVLKGLEHMTNVVGMALQGQRMGIALSVQDYIDRKDITYIGVRKDGKLKGKSATALDLSDLTRMPYNPEKISFQGSHFERPQLMALCEKLIHAGQEALASGPSGLRSDGRGRAERRSTPLQAMAIMPGRAESRGGRAESRGQSEGRGSPALSDPMNKRSRDDRVSTAATTASKPFTADSTTFGQSLGACSPLGTSESHRLPSLSPLTAR